MPELDLIALSPYTSGWSPSKGASGVCFNTNITVHVLDDGVGVNQSTIKMTVNGSQVDVTNGISGTPTDYTVTYKPLTNFQTGDVVTVTVDAADTQGNAMPQDKYSFTITYVAGPADAGQSTLTPTSASITATAPSTQTLTVTAKDANGNNLTIGGDHGNHHPVLRHRNHQQSGDR